MELLCRAEEGCSVPAGPQFRCDLGESRVVIHCLSVIGRTMQRGYCRCSRDLAGCNKDNADAAEILQDAAKVLQSLRCLMLVGSSEIPVAWLVFIVSSCDGGVRKGLSPGIVSLECNTGMMSTVEQLTGAYLGSIA